MYFKYKVNRQIVNKQVFYIVETTNIPSFETKLVDCTCGYFYPEPVIISDNLSYINIEGPNYIGQLIIKGTDINKEFINSLDQLETLDKDQFYHCLKNIHNAGEQRDEGGEQGN